MNHYAPSLAPIRQDAPEEIPVIDLGDYCTGVPGALSRSSAELRHALQDVGFYFVTNHGVPDSLIAGAFDAARRFHGQPEETKLALRLNQHNVGYLPFKSSVTRHSKLNDNNRPNLVEAFFTKREMPADAEVQPFRAPNRWPDNLPGFRDAVLPYQNALEALGKSLLPLYAHGPGSSSRLVCWGLRRTNVYLAAFPLSSAGRRRGK
jgi:isopenicillin N synthase-like dioxygenase